MAGAFGCIDFTDAGDPFGTATGDNGGGGSRGKALGAGFVDLFWFGAMPVGPDATFLAGILRPAGSVETGLKMPFVPIAEGLPVPSTEGRGPSFNFGLYSYARFMSLVLGREDCVDILSCMLEKLVRGSNSYIERGLELPAEVISGKFLLGSLSCLRGELSVGD